MAGMPAAKLPLPDDNPNAVNTLRHKRAEIAGRIAMLEVTAEQLRADLVHLDATLRILDPNTIPDDIGAIRIVPRRTDWFPRGEVTRRIYEALRDVPDVRAQDLADAAMAEKGVPATDRMTRRLFVNLFLNTMHHLVRKGKLAKIGRGPGVRFRLAEWEPGLI
jgi:hypothetical protein